MSIITLFSKRQKKLRGEIPDIYTYDTIPAPLKAQIIHIWFDTLGDRNSYHDDYKGTKGAYKFIVESLRQEYGLFSLPGSEDLYGPNHFAELVNFLMQERDAERALDAIELSFKVIDHVTRKFDYLQRSHASELADAAIEELNFRFREHGVGYEFNGGEIIRVDSQLLHAEVVKPALVLLRAHEYAGAQAEFLTAHEHYRHGRAKEALNECLKALESVVKAICARRGWTHSPNATAIALIQILFDNGLIPSFWSQHFSALRSTLEAGVPTVRNRLGGHGQGSQVVEVPTHLVSYALHLTGSAIVFLVEAEKALP